MTLATMTCLAGNLEYETPNIDRMAAEGQKWTNFIPPLTYALLAVLQF